MTMRTITPTLAGVLEELELEQPGFVTMQDIERLGRAAGVTWSPALLARRLRERGWLLDTGVRGVWEFAPASRAGTFGAGDRLAVFRAVLSRDPESGYQVAEESAAFLLGYSSRPPAKEVIAALPGANVPPALRSGRVVRWQSKLEPASVSGLPVWRVETLLAAMSARPSSYGDWPNVGDWITAAVGDADLADLRLELKGKARAAWARASYLLWLADRREDADLFMADAPPGMGPFYLGDRDKEGSYFRRFEVIDSAGMEVIPQ